MNKTSKKSKTKVRRKTKKPLGTAAEELRACIAAFKKFPQRKLVWCCHHESLYEYNGGYRQRLAYIRRDKADEELAVRYRNFRPVKGKEPSDNYRKALAQFNKEWPGNTWSAKWESIFKVGHE